MKGFYTFLGILMVIGLVLSLFGMVWAISLAVPGIIVFNIKMKNDNEKK